MVPVSNDTLSVKLDRIEGQLGLLNDAMIALARLEERHETTAQELTRAVSHIEQHQAQIENIERALPALIETRKWVIGLASAVAMAVVGAGVKLVVVDPPAPRDTALHAPSTRP